jgi:mono/diheme cytochrome c family protein
MRKTGSATVLAVLLAGVAVGATAARAKPVTYNPPPETAKFKPGPGVEVAIDNCSVCHSADYILTQPPKRGKKFWETEVHKMIKVYGATSITKEDAEKIADYLAATY